MYLGVTPMRLLIFMTVLNCVASSQTFVRVNQVGFRPEDRKSAVVLSTTVPSSDEMFEVVKLPERRPVFSGILAQSLSVHGRFKNVSIADFSNVKTEGIYAIRVGAVESDPFPVNLHAYTPYRTFPLFYMLEQRCGYNPVFDTTCHTMDGIAVDGPDHGSHIDNVGGYHDASDYLRFLITTSYTVGIHLLTYVDYPNGWPDTLDARGHRAANGIPDILDEARWGLEWMLKMNPAQGKLYHQSADDRDHSFWDLPFRDNTDYGWGKGGSRPVYFATGKPQGLQLHFNTSTGVSNIAARTAAVFALASDIWLKQFADTDFAAHLLGKAKELYTLAKEHPGTSESVPGKAPYRFHEATYHDDLEWAATELMRTTGNRDYLEEAVHFGRLAADSSWMGKDTARHYEYFPYVNPGHYRLFPLVSEPVQKELKELYRRGLLATKRRAEKNAFQYGVPFIWVSNNLATGLVTQAIFYKKMGGSDEFDDILFATRDWLFGRNPWGQSFVIGVPVGGRYPNDPHSVVTKELGLPLTGSLVDGPVYGSIFASLKGLRLTKEDRFANFQSDEVVYHDDLGDYSTNEPTIDGTAALLYIFAHFSGGK